MPPLRTGGRDPRQRGFRSSDRGTPVPRKREPVLRSRGTPPSVEVLPSLGNGVPVARRRGICPSQKKVSVPLIKVYPSQGKRIPPFGKGVPAPSKTGYPPLGKTGIYPSFGKRAPFPRYAGARHQERAYLSNGRGAPVLRRGYPSLGKADTRLREEAPFPPLKGYPSSGRGEPDLG